MKKLQNMTFERKAVLYTLVAAFLVLFLGIWLWYQFVFANAERTFWGMIDANLQTRGVTRYISQQTQSSKLEQYLQLELGATNAAKSITTIEQSDAGTGQSTRVVTEAIGVPNATYSRYSDIKTSDNRQFGSLLETWGKEEANAESESQSVFSEAVYGVVPFARLDTNQRAEVTEFIRDNNVYDVDFSKAEKIEAEGKTAYKYPVTVNTVAYIKMLQLVDKMMGLDQLSRIDANSYSQSPVIPMEISVGIDSRQLLKTKYQDVEREETYSSYGIQSSLQEPRSSIPRGELERKLQKALGTN